MNMSTSTSTPGMSVRHSLLNGVQGHVTEQGQVGGFDAARVVDSMIR